MRFQPAKLTITDKELREIIAEHASRAGYRVTGQPVIRVHHDQRNGPDVFEATVDVVPGPRKEPPCSPTE